MIGWPRFVVDALGDGDDAAAVFLVDAFDVADETVDREGALRQVDQMRAVVVELAPQCRCRGQEARVAAHHDGDIDARKGAVVEIGAGEGERDEARGGTESGGVVVDRQVVVDRLRDVDAAQVVFRFLRLFADDAQRIRRIVAADIEECADLVGLQDLEDFLAVFQVGLVAGRAQRRTRRVGDVLQVVGGFERQVDEFLVDDAAHAVGGAIDAFDGAELARFDDRADHGFVDHGGGTATLSDEHFTLEHSLSSFGAGFRRIILAIPPCASVKRRLTYGST